MSALIRFGQLSIKQGLTLAPARQLILCRHISVSPKKNETSAEPNPYIVKKPWVSYGFDYEDERKDRHLVNLSFFFAITIALVCGGFSLAYTPDTKLREWAQREAFLQLRYKEEHGLPPIDRNYIDPAKVKLPDDAELGNTEIII